MARALVIAMPITMVAAGAGRQGALPRPQLGRGVPAGGGALADRPGRHLGGRHLAARAGLGPPHAQPRVRPQRRPGAALRPLLPRPRRRPAATPAPKRRSWSARPRSGAAIGVGPRRRSAAAFTTTCPGGGLTARYEGIYAVGFALFAFGLAEVTIGNGLIAAFVCGIAMAATERDVPEGFVEFAENTSAILQVLTFFVFGAPDRRHRLPPQRPAAGRLRRLRPARRPAGWR